MNIENVIKESHSLRECMKKLNWNITGTNYNKIKKIIKENKINVDHFKDRKIGIPYVKKYDISELLVENSEYSRGSLKRRLINENLLTYECSMCKNNGNWMGKKISLVLDHINGINNDNRLENLRFLCPNCNATTETFCGKNVKNSKYEKINKKCSCGNPIFTEHAENCVECGKKKTRKTERPSYETLLIDINELGFSGTGRKYNVSDNSIRKWKRYYEK